MYVAVFFLCILLSGSLSGLILPMTKPDGSTDLSSLLSHVTLLEQTVTGLQTTTVQLQSDLQSNKAQAAAEISSLKDEVVSLKTELRVSSNDLAVLKAEVNDMKRGNSNANTQVNLTVLDSISHEVKLNTAQVSAVQSDVKMLHKQLSLVNSTVYDVKREADSLIKNTSSMVQLLTHKQVVENMELQSTNALALRTSQQVERLELDMNTTSAGLHMTQKNLNVTSTEVTTLRNDLSVVQKQSLDNKHSLTQVSQDVQLVSADVHTAKNNISLTISEVATLKADLAVVRKQALDNKQLVTTLASNNRNVAFQAQSQPIFSPSGTPLTFLDVDYNAGSAYNNKTSKFTAPVSGTYMFWTQLEMSGIYSNMYVRIMKSGVNVAAGRVETHSTVGNVDASAVTVNHLNKGEEVWVEISFPSLIAGENGSSYFGGVMLSADK
ncbi:multimerin-2-like isoform X1 [Haliotis rufescens]|uniref:multimerin-2-like isoform X1 n=1 Tax=Haliotis rufescens TaxID=6454 RepID=UPI00201F81F7|nr:multimerin-2-like isoform X1 [Haliotis rufescens]